MTSVPLLFLRWKLFAQKTVTVTEPIHTALNVRLSMPKESAAFQHANPLNQGSVLQLNISFST